MAGSADKLVPYFLQEEVLYDLREAYEEFMRPNETNLVRASKNIYAKTNAVLYLLLMNGIASSEKNRKV